jgi:hypothetical protein
VNRKVVTLGSDMTLSCTIDGIRQPRQEGAVGKELASAVFRVIWDDARGEA